MASHIPALEHRSLHPRLRGSIPHLQVSRMQRGVPLLGHAGRSGTTLRLDGSGSALDGFGLWLRLLKSFFFYRCQRVPDRFEA